jgi:hypothetical protein
MLSGGETRIGARYVKFRRKLVQRIGTQSKKMVDFSKERAFNLLLKKGIHFSHFLLFKNIIQSSA